MGRDHAADRADAAAELAVGLLGQAATLDPGFVAYLDAVAILAVDLREDVDAVGIAEP